MYHGVGCKIGNSLVVFSLNSLVAKTLACRAGDPGSIPGWGVIPLWHLPGRRFVLDLSKTDLIKSFVRTP